MKRCLVYSEDRVIEDELPITKSLKKAMGKSLKKYFYSYRDGKTKLLHLDGVVPKWDSQDW